MTQMLSPSLVARECLSVNPVTRQFTVYNGEQRFWQSQSDFEISALRTDTLPAREYTAVGLSTKIVVTESYGVMLDTIRDLRIAANQPAVGLKWGSGGEPIPSAQEQLAAQPHRNRVLPEELATLIRSMPIPGYFVDARLLDWNNALDYWLRQKYNSTTFTSAMEVTRAGQLRMFQTENNEFVRQNLTHEWSHRLCHVITEQEWKRFSDAVAMEWAFYVPNSYALTSYEEHFAVIGEELLHLDVERFNAMAKKGPVRTVTWMLAFEARLLALPAEERGTWHDELLRRCRYTREIVLPKAKEYLAMAATLQTALADA